MADEEQYDGQEQNQGGMSSTPSRSPGMQNSSGGGGGSCVGECIRKPKTPDIGIKDLSNPRFGTMLFAEFLGTFFLVYIGCGTCRFAGPVQIAFAFGITVACIAQAIGHVSGAHLNPAVSFGLVAAGQCGLLKAICYSALQILGAIFANVMLYFTTQWDLSNANVTSRENNAHTNQWALGVSLPTAPVFPAFIIEIVLTFLLVLVVCGVCDEERKDIKGSAPLAIGLTVFVCHIMGIQYSGSSINPARSIGPLVLQYDSDDRKAGLKVIWIYIFGPLLGGVLAGFVYQLFFREKGSDSRSVAPAK